MCVSKHHTASHKNLPLLFVNWKTISLIIWTWNNCQGSCVEGLVSRQECYWQVVETQEVSDTLEGVVLVVLGFFLDPCFLAVTKSTSLLCCPLPLSCFCLETSRVSSEISKTRNQNKSFLLSLIFLSILSQWLN